MRLVKRVFLFCSLAFLCFGCHARRQILAKNLVEGPADIVKRVGRDLGMMGQKSHPKIKKVVVTIFIHGTVGSTMNIFNPFTCLDDSATDKTMSVRLVGRYRNDPLMEYDQILGPEGFTWYSSVPPKKNTIPKASDYLIPAYDAVARVVDGENISSQKMRRIKRLYATYGWSGLLSQRARREAAELLYQTLIDLREKLKKKYGVVPEFHLVSHSHGGNVLLLLGELEEIHQKGLAVDLGIMLGTPMQEETAPCIASPVFKKLYLLRSDGDGVQQIDYFSTRVRRSYGRMSNITNLKEICKKNKNFVRCDVRLFVEHLRKRVTHANMWLAGRSVPVFPFMEPMPYVVLVPLVVKGLRSVPIGQTAVDAHVHEDKDRCWATINLFPVTYNQNKKRRRLKKPTNAVEQIAALDSLTLEFHEGEEAIYTVIEAHANRMRNEWWSTLARSAHPIFNTKNGKVLTNLLCWW